MLHPVVVAVAVPEVYVDGGVDVCPAITQTHTLNGFLNVYEIFWYFPVKSRQQKYFQDVDLKV